MNIWRDDSNYQFASGGTRHGYGYEISEIPGYYLAASDEAVVAISPAGTAPLRPQVGRYIARGFAGLDPEAFFLVDVGGDDVEFLLNIGMRPLSVLSSSIFIQGEPADDNILPSAEVFHPPGREFEAAPRSARTSDSPHVETRILNGRRFARLTPEGVIADEAAAEAARQRRAEEAEAERLRQEEEKRLAAEAAENARLAAAAEKEGAALLENRQVLQARKAVFDEWLATRPPSLQPDSLVLDMWSSDPRVAKVKYSGVTRRDDGEYSFDVRRLGNSGQVLYCGRERAFANNDLATLWRQTDKWRQLPFWTNHDPLQVTASGRFLPYVGEPVPPGTRIPRETALAGRADPFPEASAVVMVGIDLIASDYHPIADEAFTGEDGLSWLDPIAGNTLVQVPRSKDEDDDEDEDSAEGGTKYVCKSVYEIYEHYQQGEILAGHYTDLAWKREHKHLLDAEAKRRSRNNQRWRDKKPLFEELFKACGAAFQAGKSNFGRDGLYVYLALNERDLDALILELEKSCAVAVITFHEEPVPDFLSKHTLGRKDFGVIMRAWNDCKAKPRLFHALASKALPGRQAQIEFTVEKTLPVGMVSLLVAPAKLGKSTLIYSLAASVATGQPFRGLSVKKGKVVILSEEPQSITDAQQLASLDAFECSELDITVLKIRDYKSSEDAAEDVAALGKVGLVVLDTIGAFLGDTTPAGPARAFMDFWAKFAEDHNCAVWAIHHTGKELGAAKAKSSKVVLEKYKGSGELLNAARVFQTLHVEGAAKDEEQLLRGGLRYLTVARHNIPATCSMLEGKLALPFERRTGLLAIGALSEPFLPPAPVPVAEVHVPDTDQDAHAAAPVIRKIANETGRPLAITGKKSLYYLKGPNDLAGWPRARCEKAHRRAIELGLVTKP